MLVTFTLNGQHYQALNGGAPVDYGTAASISVECPDQAEVDRVWAALTANGGSEIACGWLRDRWGVPWQIVPEALPRLLAGPDPAISGPRVSGDAKDGHAGYSRLGARGCGVMTRHLAYPDPGTPEQTRPPDSKWPRAPCRPHYAGDQKHDDAGTDRDQGGQREGWCEVCERVHEALACAFRQRACRRSTLRTIPEFRPLRDQLMRARGVRDARANPPSYARASARAGARGASRTFR